MLMKITKSQLKRIIQEELENTLNEEAPDPDRTFRVNEIITYIIEADKAVRNAFRGEGETGAELKKAMRSLNRAKQTAIKLRG